MNKLSPQPRSGKQITESQTSALNPEATEFVPFGIPAPEYVPGGGFGGQRGYVAPKIPPRSLVPPVGPHVDFRQLDIRLTCVVPPLVILVAGYRKTGKTTVAKAIAERLNYQYINVAKKENSNSCINLVQRFAPLTEYVKTIKHNVQHPIKAIIIDDAVHVSRFDPYYINHILDKANLRINACMFFDTEPADLDHVKVNELDKQTHPESYEFGESLMNYRDENRLEKNSMDSFVLLDSHQPLPELVNTAVNEIKEIVNRITSQFQKPSAESFKPLSFVELPPINFIPNAPMVNDPALVEQIIRSEAAKLNSETSEYFYCFPYVLPNFILDYSLFAKMALLFKNYLIIPWIWGTKVSVIGYEDSVYIHVPSYQLLFDLSAASPDLKKLCQVLKKQLPKRSASPETDKEDTSLVFSLEAVLKNGEIYISDMMYLDGKLGSQMLLRDRVDLMKKYFSNLNSPVYLVKHYPVNKIEECIKVHKKISSGILFINPDGMLPGRYDSRNIVFHHSEEKRAPLRLWNGVNQEVEGTWIFDLYGLDNSEEKQVEKSRIVISQSEVELNSLNNGHIVECVPGWEDDHMPKKQRTYKFVARCPWEVKPTTLYYLTAIIRPKDNPNIFVKACSNFGNPDPIYEPTS